MKKQLQKVSKTVFRCLCKLIMFCFSARVVHELMELIGIALVAWGAWEIAPWLCKVVSGVAILGLVFLAEAAAKVSTANRNGR